MQVSIQSDDGEIVYFGVTDFDVRHERGTVELHVSYNLREVESEIPDRFGDVVEGGSALNVEGKVESVIHEGQSKPVDAEERLFNGLALNKDVCLIPGYASPATAQVTENVLSEAEITGNFFYYDGNEVQRQADQAATS